MADSYPKTLWCDNERVVELSQHEELHWLLHNNMHLFKKNKWISKLRFFMLDVYIVKNRKYMYFYLSIIITK